MHRRLSGSSTSAILSVSINISTSVGASMSISTRRTYVNLLKIAGKRKTQRLDLEEVEVSSTFLQSLNINQIMQSVFHKYSFVFALQWVQIGCCSHSPNVLISIRWDTE